MSLLIIIDKERSPACKWLLCDWEKQSAEIYFW